MYFWEKQLSELNENEWEMLCDGCGLCCLNKLEDCDTGKVYTTRIACNLLDLACMKCSHYETRHQYVPDCIKLTFETLQEITWLPSTCAYRLRKEGKPLPDWHPLLAQEKQNMKKVLNLSQYKFIHEDDAKKSFQHYIISKDF